jgi:hypothetical protein
MLTPNIPKHAEIIRYSSPEHALAAVREGRPPEDGYEIRAAVCAADQCAVGFWIEEPNDDEGPSSKDDYWWNRQ